MRLREKKLNVTIIRILENGLITTTSITLQKTQVLNLIFIEQKALTLNIPL